MGADVSPDITVNPRSVTVITTFSLVYLLLTAVCIGLRTDHLFLVLLCNALFYAGAVSRKFLIAFLTYLVYWIIFDYMKVFPNFRYRDVHLADLYELEKKWLGIQTHGRLLTLNEYFADNHNALLDVITGLFYLCWVPVPFAFATYLFIKNRNECILFNVTFLVVNLLGFLIYYLYPAAPPWYVAEYGFIFHPDVGEGIAGLSRFDNFFHAPVFAGLYTKGSNVFAAMPSLHSAYPVIVFYFACRNRMRAAAIVFGIVMTGIWFAAVYTGHHYVLDVIAGLVCAAMGILLFRLLFRRVAPFRHFIVHYSLLAKSNRQDLQRVA